MNAKKTKGRGTSGRVATTRAAFERTTTRLDPLDDPFEELVNDYVRECDRIAPRSGQRQVSPEDF